MIEQGAGTVTKKFIIHKESTIDTQPCVFSFLGITVLVFVSLTLLFSIINTHKSGAHLMLGFIITGFALCLWHLVRIKKSTARISPRAHAASIHAKHAAVLTEIFLLLTRLLSVSFDLQLKAYRNGDLGKSLDVCTALLDRLSTTIIY